MTRSQVAMSSLIRAADSAGARPGMFINSHRRLRTVLIGMVSCGVIATVLIPFRDSVGAANIALALVIVVGLVGSSEGILAGLVTAFWAAALFALLHSIPHGHPRIEDEQDVVTGALLIGAGLISGLQHAVTAKLRTRLVDANYGLARVHQVAEVAVGDGDDDDIMRVTCEQIQDELRLADCSWDSSGIDSGRWHSLQHSGLIAGTTSTTDPERLGEMLAEGVAIDLGTSGRLLLRGLPNSRPTPHQFKVVVILADFAAASVIAQNAAIEPIDRPPTE